MKTLIQRLRNFMNPVNPHMMATAPQPEPHKTRKTTHSKPKVHKIDPLAMTLEQRITSLEKALEEHKIEIAQMKGEFHVEMKYAKDNTAREELRETYYKLKEEAAIYAKGLTTQLNTLKRQLQ